MGASEQTEAVTEYEATERLWNQAHEDLAEAFRAGNQEAVWRCEQRATALGRKLDFLRWA